MRRGRLKSLFLAVCVLCLGLSLITIIRTKGRPILKSQQLLFADRTNWYLRLDKDQYCQYPQPNPWDESILRFVYDTPPVRCRKVQPEVAYVDSDNFLRINRTELSDSWYWENQVTCTYREIVRPLGKDNEISYGPEKSVGIGQELRSDLVLVKCKNWFGITFYSDVLAHPRKTVRKFRPEKFRENSENKIDPNLVKNTHPNFIRKNSEKINPEKFREDSGKFDPNSTRRNSETTNQNTFEKNSEKKIPENFGKNSGIFRPLSVAAFGIDSMSRLNFIRQLPLTYEFLTKTMRSFVLRGMTRVGDNTYPNLIAALTGQASAGSRFDRPPMGIFFDDWPLIWRNFSDAGFTTLLAEDVPEFTIFNYASSGFYRQPTDHYFRPFYVAIESDTTHRLSSNLCFGSKPKHVIHSEFVRKFLSDPEKRPNFSVSFLTELSHNLLNRVGSGDVDFRNFVRDLYSGGHLNDTIFIFFSDHGHRFDEILMTPIGRVEGSMPFVAIFIPEWVKKSNLVAERNLDINSGRLTTMFDLHETFVDILRYNTIGTGLGDHFEHVSPWGVSLFGEIPANRTCVSAGIKDQFCACAKEHEMRPDDERSVAAGQSVVKRINEVTKVFQNKCALLGLNEIRHSYRIASDDGKGAKVRVVVETTPGGGVYEGIVVFGDEARTLGEPSRINRYAGQDWCVTEAMKSDVIDLRKFCYCI